MLNEPKTNELIQKEMTDLLGEIIDKVARFNNIFDGLSPQDKTLVGGLVFGMYNPWTDSENFQFSGTQLVVPAVLNKLLQTYNVISTTKPKFTNPPGTPGDQTLH